jgi:methylaspartate ammonia-lyase
MKIKKMLIDKGFAGYFWLDRTAIKKNSEKDGLIYRGNPITPGFKSIIVPAEASCIQLVMDDENVGYGDCVAVVYTGCWGRDPYFDVTKYNSFMNDKLIAYIEGYEINDFKTSAEYFDSLEINGEHLHTAIRYGLTQALLDAISKSKKMTMAEVIAEDYNLKIANDIIPIFGQTGEDFYSNTEKMILLKLHSLPHSSTKTLSDFEDLLNKIKWTKKKVFEIGGKDYKPALHFDIYGTIGWYFNCDIKKMTNFFKDMEEACYPLELSIEAPVEMDSQKEHIEMMKKLKQSLAENKINVKIAADEWCNTLSDIKKFADENAVDMINVKTPDLGGINNVIEAVKYCKEKSILPYMGGSAAETERSAQICSHLALAITPYKIMERPGTGVLEGTSIIYNEMKRALSLIKYRKEINK